MGRPSIDMYKRCPRYRIAKYRLVKFLAIRSQIQRPRKKSPHHRAAFKLCAIANFHIGERPACGSTAPRFATIVTAKQTHSRIVVTGRFSGFANERRRPNARSNSFDTRWQG